MRHHWLMALILITLLAPFYPVYAEIVTVDPPDEEHQREPILDTDELERLSRLQRTALQVLLSPISPDDTTVLAAIVRPGSNEPPSIVLLNVNDGSMTSANRLLEQFLPLSNIVWRDSNTLAMVALSLANFSPLLVYIDRTTLSAVDTRQLPPDFVPVNLAPNGTRLLGAIIPTEEENSGVSTPTDSAFPIQIRLRPPDPFWQAFPPSLKRIFMFQNDDTMDVSSNQIQLAYYNANSQQLVSLVSLPENTALMSQPAWSSDGGKLAVVRTTLDNAARGNVSLNNMVTQDALGNLPPAENSMFAENVVDIFDLSSNEVSSSQIRAADGNGDIFARATWSTDGSTLLMQMQRPSRLTGRTYPIYTYAQSSYVRFYDPATRQVTGVLDIPQINSPLFTQPLFVSPGEVIFSTVYGLSARLYYYNRDTGEFSEISDRPGSYGLLGVPLSGQVLATRFSRLLVFSYSSFQSPPELYRITWEGTALAALTHSNSELEQLSQVQVNQVSFTLASGAVREGYLLQPAGAPFPPRNSRIVVWQEGGPGLAIYNQWGSVVERPFNLLPNFGISLLVMPFPGREGWGPQFYNGLADGQNFGAIDIDEAAEVVQQMIARGYTAADRVGITGCSYGGYFTSQSIARHPGLYAAANTQCTLLDMITEWQTGFTVLVSYLMGNAPGGSPGEYVQDSPGFNATRVRTPTLIFHGTQDFLPVNIAENFHETLEKQGVPVKMLKFVDEGHGLAALDNQLLAAQEQLLWFRRYLSDGPVSVPVVSVPTTVPPTAALPTTVPETPIPPPIVSPTIVPPTSVPTPPLSPTPAPPIAAPPAPVISIPAIPDVDAPAHPGNAPVLVQGDNDTVRSYPAVRAIIGGH